MAPGRPWWAGIALATLPVLAAGETAVRGPQLDWALNCQGCHQSDGAGVPGRVPALKDQVARFLGVEGGREFLVRVPGVARSPLDDAEIAALVTWMVRSMDPSHVPADFAPYTRAEVAAVRPRRYPSVAAARAALVARFPSP